MTRLIRSFRSSTLIFTALFPLPVSLFLITSYIQKFSSSNGHLLLIYIKDKVLYVDVGSYFDEDGDDHLITVKQERYRLKTIISMDITRPKFGAWQNL